MVYEQKRFRSKVRYRCIENANPAVTVFTKQTLLEPNVNNYTKKYVANKPYQIMLPAEFSDSLHYFHQA